MLDCRIDSIKQTLNFHIRIENFAADAKVALAHASAFEREGEEFFGAKSGIVFSDNIKSSKETSVSIEITGVPIQTDYIRNLKFSVYNSNTEQETIAVFENITVAK